MIIYIMYIRLLRSCEDAFGDGRNVCRGEARFPDRAGAMREYSSFSRSKRSGEGRGSRRPAIPEDDTGRGSEVGDDEVPDARGGRGGHLRGPFSRAHQDVAAAARAVAGLEVAAELPLIPPQPAPAPAPAA